MARARAKKKRPSIWDDSYRPYGTYEGERGNPRQWKEFFQKAMGLDEAQAIMKDDNPYIILGVSVGCTLSDIKGAFRSLAKQTHPDHGGTEEAFKRVHAAYTLLKGRFE